jgi:two-component system sensor histidine kinase CpxA
LIFISSIWLVQQLDSGVKYRPLKPEQQKELKSVARKFQYQIDKNKVKLQKQALQLSKRSRYRIFLIDPEKSQVIYGVNKRNTKAKQLLEQFDTASSALLMETEGQFYIGPATIIKDNKPYLVFISMPQRGGLIGVIRYQYPEIFLFFLISFSGALCYLFVASLLKPIVQLQKASKLMASGDLATRVGKASTRMDEIGQLSRDFNSMSDKVETLLNGQKRLLADISHELRSPLARLQLSIGIAQQSNPDPSSSAHVALERIEKEASQIESMIAQVLMLSKLDNQQNVLNLQTVAFQQLMLPIIDDVKFEAEQKNKQLIYDSDLNANLSIDPQLMSSAIENILRNAIHYSKKCIKVCVVEKNESVIWTILDDGDGMEEEQLKRIFEPFYRSSTARDRHSGGVGLGLAIAFRAIIQHQGQLVAKNSQQGGLEVTITLPLELEVNHAD